MQFCNRQVLVLKMMTEVTIMGDAVHLVTPCQKERKGTQGNPRNIRKLDDCAEMIALDISFFLWSRSQRRNVITV